MLNVHTVIKNQFDMYQPDYLLDIEDVDEQTIILHLIDGRTRINYSIGTYWIVIKCSHENLHKAFENFTLELLNKNIFRATKKDLVCIEDKVFLAKVQSGESKPIYKAHIKLDKPIETNEDDLFILYSITFTAGVVIVFAIFIYSCLNLS